LNFNLPLKTKEAGSFKCKERGALNAKTAEIVEQIHVESPRKIPLT
jgi:hypothetical protein